MWWGNFSRYGMTPEKSLLKLKIGELLKSDGFIAVWVTNFWKLQDYVVEELFPAWNVVLISTLYWLKVHFFSMNEWTFFYRSIFRWRSWESPYANLVDLNTNCHSKLCSLALVELPPTKIKNWNCQRRNYLPPYKTHRIPESLHYNVSLNFQAKLRYSVEFGYNASNFMPCWIPVFCVCCQFAYNVFLR